MTSTAIRLYQPEDRADLLAAIIDFQDYERQYHDSRLPGEGIAEPYLDRLLHLVATENGSLFIAEQAGKFAGYLCCVVAQEDNLCETADSNRFGLVMDTYVVPAKRGLGIAGELLTVAEAHLAKHQVTRLRIGVLAANSSAINAYRKHGFDDYEMVLEKRIAP